MSNSNIPKKAIFAFAVIAGTVGMMIGMTTVPYTQTAVADKGGVPNDNALSGPACDNADERNERFHERLFDDNTNNDKGQAQAHTSSEHNNRGVEFNNC